MANVTVALESTTLYHNVANTEDDLSQMLLMIIIGGGAALLAICTSNLTKFCQRGCKCESKEIRDSEDDLESGIDTEKKVIVNDENLPVPLTPQEGFVHFGLVAGSVVKAARQWRKQNTQDILLAAVVINSTVAKNDAE